jgi:hypothetical protein
MLYPLSYEGGPEQGSGWVRRTNRGDRREQSSQSVPTSSAGR